MKSIKKIILAFFFFKAAFVFAYGIYGTQQLIQGDHWLLEALELIGTEQKNALLINTSPISVEEIRIQMKKIDYESLSENAKALYDRMEEYIERRRGFKKIGAFTFALNIKANPEILYKSNNEIDWSFATDYTGSKGYGASSNYSGNRDVKTLLALPLYFDFGDTFFMEAEPFFKKNYWGFSKANNFLNIPFSSSELEFLIPTNAYINIGKAFDGWGFNFFVAKEGLCIGRTQTGSVLYNSTFQTDAVFQMNLYSPRFKYNLNIAEVDRKKYFYLHYIDLLPFNWLRLGVLEGTLVNAAFDLRYLNPLMTMHSFGSWNDYCSPEEKAKYNEANVCAYFGFDFDISPLRYLRFYGLYAQNELQSFLELDKNPDNVGNYYPDSFAFQFGSEVNIPAWKNGYWKGSIEAVYASPYCYIKQSPSWSLHKERLDMNSSTKLPVASWVGTPFGPDSISVQGKLQYISGDKWNASVDYIFVAHGEKSFGIFQEKDSDGWYKYYPAAKWLQKGSGLTAEEKKALSEKLRAEARNLLPSGIVSFTNTVTARGLYKVNRNFSFEGKVSYTFIFNHKNVKNAFAHGVELALSGSWSLF